MQVSGDQACLLNSVMVSNSYWLALPEVKISTGVQLDVNSKWLLWTTDPYSCSACTAVLLCSLLAVN